MTSEEIAGLLREAADWLDRGADPLGLSFLREHEISLDQARSLAKQLAIGARIAARGIESPTSPQGVAVAWTLAEELT
jgi:hypothetical protein